MITKTLRIVILLPTLLIRAADTPPVPGPVPPDRREDISAQMLALKDAQIQYLIAKQTLDETVAAYARYVETLRKEFHAEGCELRRDKSWDCPPQHPAAVPPPPVSPGPSAK